MGLHPGERRGAKGTDLGGQFVGPKSIARFLVKLLKPDHEHKPGEPEADMRRTMGRTVTAGGSVISSRLPTRKPRPDDRIVDTRDARRLGTVATVNPDGSMRVHWDDGSHEIRPQESVTSPLREPARSFDAHPLSTSPAVRKMTASRAPAGDHVGAAQSHVDALQAPASSGDPWQQNMDGVKMLLAGVSSADLSRIARDAGIQLGRDQSVDDRRDTIARHMASFGSSDDAPGEIRDAMERLSIAPKKTAPKAAVGSDFAPGGAKHIDARHLGAGLNVDAATLDRVQRELDAGKSPRQAARDLRDAANGDLDLSAVMNGGSKGIGGGDLAGQHSAALDAARQQHAEAHRLADRLESTSRPRAAAKASPAAAKMARGKAAVPVSITAGELSAMASREQGHAAVASLKKTELVAMARELHIARPTTMKADDLRREIVDATIGRQLDSIATRGFRGDIHSPEVHADGLDTMQPHSLKSYGEEWIGPEARTMSGDQIKAQLRRQGVGSPEVEQAKRIAAEPPKAPAAHSEAQIVDRVHAAVRKLERRPGGWVGLADLRAEVGPDVPRQDLDRVLTRIRSSHAGLVVPENNQKALTPADRAAEVVIGGERQHLISLEHGTTPADIHTRFAAMDQDVADYRARVAAEDAARRGLASPSTSAPPPASQSSSLRAALYASGQGPRYNSREELLAANALPPEGSPSAPSHSPAVAKMTRAKAAPAKKAAQPAVSITRGELSAMSTREQAHAAVARLKKPELIALAKELSVPRASSASVASLRSAIVERTVGNRLDSLAIRGTATLPY